MKTSTDIQIYNFAAGEKVHAIRVAFRDGASWFVASDVCSVLDIADVRQALERLDDDERGGCSIPTPGGVQEVRGVNESGLYSLILGSRKPEAKPFKRWLTHEVLPSIRRHGVYIDSTNRMGETLGDATADQLNIERPATVGDTHSLFAAVAALHQEQQASSQALRDLLTKIASDNTLHRQQARDMQRTFTQTVGRMTRIAKAQRASNKNLDPNRPLSEDDVERFKYLLGTGATAKQIARSLNRTYEVIRRFMDTNQDLVIRTLQHSLL